MTFKKFLVFIFLFNLITYSYAQKKYLGVGLGLLGMKEFQKYSSSPNLETSFTLSSSIFLVNVKYMFIPRPKFKIYKANIHTSNLLLGLKTNTDRQLFLSISAGAQVLFPSYSAKPSSYFLINQINPIFNLSIYYNLTPKNIISLNYYLSRIRTTVIDRHSNGDIYSFTNNFTLTYLFQISRRKRNKPE